MPPYSSLVYSCSLFVVRSPRQTKISLPTRAAAQFVLQSSRRAEGSRRTPEEGRGGSVRAIVAPRTQLCCPIRYSRATGRTVTQCCCGQRTATLLLQVSREESSALDLEGIEVLNQRAGPIKKEVHSIRTRSLHRVLPRKNHTHRAR